jgi:hypothetical protein
MQHIAEQYPRSTESSREPMHWSQAIRFGALPSDGRFTWPPYGPDAERIRSNYRLVTTFG